MFTQYSVNYLIKYINMQKNAKRKQIKFNAYEVVPNWRIS